LLASNRRRTEMSDCTLCRLYSEEAGKADQEAQDSEWAMNRASDDYVYRLAEGTRKLALARAIHVRDQLIRHKREHH
jgi:hypothetical protein